MDNKKKENEDFKKIFNRSTNEEEQNGWGGQGNYMAVKNQKLEDQIKESFSRVSNIFNGVSIWVNGYTRPSSDELKRMISQHGGKYQHFFSKTHVTHVIATNLPQSKIKDLKKNDKVVHPDWIVDSIAVGRLLNLNKYLLYSVGKRDGNSIKFPTQQRNKSGLSPSETNTLAGNQEMDQEMMSDDQNPAEDENDFMDVDFEKETNPQEAPCLSKHDYSNLITSKAPLKAGDDNFISEFYTHSRLHHLSMWKAELKKFASSIQKKRTSVPVNNSGIGEHGERVIMHVDLDSFFVSVALKQNKHLVGKPVAVCHSGRNVGEGKDYSKSFSEIASCSYEARKFGLHNGMMLFKAKKLCPQLVCVPYYFEEYRDVSQKFYEVLSGFTCNIEAVSCDEALLDLTDLVSSDGTVLEIAESIRSEILLQTDCTASCGIGNSILIGRLATKQAKPNGKCYVTTSEIPEFIKSQNVKDLPGIGWAQGRKLDSLNVVTCGDLQKFMLLTLQKEFGQKLGQTLYNFCRGEDNRMIKLEHERKSVSAEINYGMRFKEYSEVEKFVYQLSSEVEKRLKEIQKVGQHITLKLMTRLKNAPDPAKFMGHGWCETLSRSCSLHIPTDSAKLIAEKCCNILRTLHLQPDDFRGMGIQMTKLSDTLSAPKLATNLFQFAKPMSAEELHERDRVLVATSDKSEKQLAGNSKIEKTMENFMKPSSKFKEVDCQEITLPALPSFDVFASSSTVVHSDSKGSTNYQGQFSNWDPDILKELPEDIQKELRAHKQSQATVADNQSNNLSPSTRLAKANRKNSPSHASPKRKTRLKKNKEVSVAKYADVRTIVANPKLSRQLYKLDSNSLPVSSAISEDMLLSPSKIDLDIVNELPEEIQHEIMTKMKKTGCLPKQKQSNVVDSSTSNLSTGKLTVNACKEGKSLKQPVESLLLSPSQLDQSFLKALPDDLRQDVLNDAVAVKKNRSCEMSENSNECDSTKGDGGKPITTLKLVHTKEASQEKLVNSQYLLSPSQLDQSFLKALPEDVKNDVLFSAENVRKNKNAEKSIVNENNVVTPISKTSAKKRMCGESDTSCGDFLFPSQIDSSVFQALPVAIQNEVLLQAKLEKRRKLKLEKNKNSTPFDELLCKPNEPEMEELYVEKVVSPLSQVLPSLYEASKYTDVKILIKNWVQEYDEPLVEDLEEMQDYFHKLLQTYNMETLHNILLYLKRVTLPKTSWHSSFNNLLQNVQHAMKDRYRGSLPISKY